MARPVRTIDDVAEILVARRLVGAAIMDQCRAAVGAGAGIPQLLQHMQQQQVLTSWQATRVEKSLFDELVVGNYKLLYRNGAGSLARVFRAVSLNTGQNVALKLLRQRWLDNRRSLAEFQNEFEISHRLRHPNIVAAFDSGHDRDQHWFTLEFVEGGTLRDLLHVRKRLPPDAAARCMIELCSALQHALTQGFTHRDVRTSNILMAMDGTAKLGDFGLSLPKHQPPQRGDHQVIEYEVVERHTGVQPGDSATDLFFAGAVMFELLAGQPPWPASQDRDACREFQRYSSIPSVQAVSRDIPHDLARITDKLLKLNPRERYQLPQQVVADLMSLSGLPTPDRAGSRTPTAKPDGSGSSPIPAADADSQLTVIVIEDRDAERDLLRKHLTKFGHRVILLSDVERGLQRIRSATPPDCLILMGESIGARSLDKFHEAEEIAATNGVRVLLVLATPQASAWRDRISPQQRDRVLVPPVTMKGLNAAIRRSVNR